MPRVQKAEREGDGCSYERVAQEILVQDLFCILTALVVTQIYRCDRIHTHTSTTKTNEIKIRWVDCIDINFLVVIL